ncbi:MAG: fasciclin domain-containing protein [Myxococcota bacterium]
MRLRLLKHVVLGLSLALTTAACGDDDDDNGETPTNPGPGDSGDDGGGDGGDGGGDDGGGDDGGGDEGTDVFELIAARDDLTTLAGLIENLDEETAALIATPGLRFTIFAPSDAAFARLGELGILLTDIPEASLTAILTYHVLLTPVMASMIEDDGLLLTALPLSSLRFDLDAEQNVLINGLTRVTEADLEGSNGVVHIVDTLMIPPQTTGVEFPGSVLDAVVYYSGLSTLAGAANMDIQNALGSTDGDGITLLAPTNEGFGDNPMLIPEDAATISTLQYHVIAEPLSSADIMAATMVGPISRETLEGSNVSVSVSDNVVNVNDSTVIFADLVTSNGVIHVLDAALNPDDAP